VQKRKALISVSRKEGVVELAKELKELGFEIISTGGTYNLLKESGVEAVQVSDITGFPEILDGRVKTLHPFVHAGILANRNNPEHVAQLVLFGIEPIDLVVVNLYPLRRPYLMKTLQWEMPSRTSTLEVPPYKGSGKELGKRYCFGGSTRLRASHR